MADAVLYWQWRSAPGGQEQYHGSLIDQSGQPRPFYAEAQQLGGEFKIASEWLAGSVVKTDVAVLNCYDSRWSIGGSAITTISITLPISTTTTAPSPLEM